MNDELIKVVESRHDRPHDVLGPHRSAKANGELIIRAFFPDVEEVTLFIKQPIDKVVRMRREHPDGVFIVQIDVPLGDLDYVYRVTDRHKQRLVIRDPYQTPPDDLSAKEEKEFAAGRHNFLFRHFGAHVETRNNLDGVRFGVWAPHAQRISVVGSFNGWDGRHHVMQKISPAGFWELFVPDVKNGDFYKYEIRTPKGEVFLKSDPYAFRIEDVPEAAAIVCDVEQTHDWRDGDWMRQARPESLAIYKVEPDGFLISESQLNKIKKQGYTHLGIPAFYDADSNNVMLFSPHPAYTTPQQIMDWIDCCHNHGLGVIIDGAPLSLKTKQHNLVCFDGDPLYESSDKSEEDGFSFDLDNLGVKNFLLSYACYWREIYHIDGFRLDTEMHRLYRDLLTTSIKENNGILWLIDEAETLASPSKEMLKNVARSRRFTDPFAMLGAHQQAPQKGWVVRAILPKARQAYVHDPDYASVWYPMRSYAEDFWQASIPGTQKQFSYRLHRIDQEGKHKDFPDTYAFDVTFIGEDDKRRFSAGNHYHIYQVLGAHQKEYGDVSGVNFAVWAPNALAVNVVGDFNAWQGGGHPMRLHASVGIWELFIPDIGDGECYQFEIFPHDGSASFRKSDPYAFYMQTAPDTESVVYEIEDIYQWKDQAWLEKRSSANVWRSPINIYEVHLGSWRRGPGNRLLSYTEIAEQLIPYVKDMGFTHIEVLPIAEHPYEPSWGYQVSNFYAPTSRLGKPEELMAFIDLCHQNGIGVLLDWVAGHFPKDAHALAKFDGTHLYEHEDPRKGEHKDWGTLIFNYGRHEAENFLIANALFWLEHYHFDGLRVDAVASMLYLDYSRKDGEWIPNIYGGNENLEAIEFLKHTNFIVHGKFPGVLMIAEESTAWAGVSRPTDAGGLGFGFKWNMGWMHDILDYLQTPPEYRSYHHNRLAFIFHYAFEENFILSLSHDEVVHLKGSLYRKMPGSSWEKFANLRLLFFFMFTHPGKKLNFMGGEFAQVEEWSESKALQWPLLDHSPNQQLQFYFKTLNQLYRNEPVLHEMDCRPAGFSWIESNNSEQSIIVFSRKAKDPRIALIAVINFSAVSRFNYRIGVPYPVAYNRVFDSNDVRFGGTSVIESNNSYFYEDTSWHGQEFSIIIDCLPALSALLLKPNPAVDG